DWVIGMIREKVKSGWLGIIILMMMQVLILTAQAADTGTSVPVPAVYGDLGVGMEASCGYGDVVKGGRFIPVTINLSNQQSEAFHGKIKILSMETDYDIYRYEYPVTIEAGSEKRLQYNVPI